MLIGTVSQVPLKNNGISEALFCAMQTGAATSLSPPPPAAWDRSPGAMRLVPRGCRAPLCHGPPPAEL